MKVKNVMIELDELEDSELEGGESLVPSSLRDVYPNSEVKVERAQFSVFELKRKMDRKQVILDPEFQRESLWTDKQKSELVESILMGIPLPLIYLTEDKNGNLIVVDGRQRLTSLFDFLDNEYIITNLRILSDLNGKNFKKLDPKFQSKIEDYQVIAHVIKPPTSDQVKFDVFDRVNRGGTRLNNQEMRNALYQGLGTSLLKELADNEFFKKATDSSVSNKRMKDRYIILRFISFYLWRKNLYVSNRIEYKSGIDDFLGKNMEYLNNSSIDLIDMLRYRFEVAMKNAYFIFQENSFRLIADNNKRRAVNMALFESLSYLLSEVELKKKEESKIFIELFNEMLGREAFYKSLTYIIDSNKSVQERFNMMDEYLVKFKERIS